MLGRAFSCALSSLLEVVRSQRFCRNMEILMTSITSPKCVFTSYVDVALSPAKARALLEDPRSRSRCNLKPYADYGAEAGASLGGAYSSIRHAPYLSAVLLPPQVTHYITMFHNENHVGRRLGRTPGRRRNERSHELRATQILPAASRHVRRCNVIAVQSF